MKKPAEHRFANVSVSRLWNSAVFWGAVGNVLRLASSILLLPLLSVFLSKADFGFYSLLMTLATLIALVDLGFSAALMRNIGYAMSGARDLAGVGSKSATQSTGRPNPSLLFHLLGLTRTVYRWLALGTLLILGAWGTYWTFLYAPETSNPSITWAAWGLTLLGGVAEMYSGWWNTYLRGLNLVTTGFRIQAAVGAARLVLAVAFIYSGLGLMSLPLATLVTSFAQRLASKRHTLRYLSQWQPAEPSHEEKLTLFKTLWPGCWRVGIHCIGYYLVPHGTNLICSDELGLEENARYGLSLQAISIAHSMAGVWLVAKWPEFAQLYGKGQLDSLQRLFRNRLGLQTLSFIIIAGSAVMLGNTILEWIGSDKTTLQTPLFFLMAAIALMDLHTNSWITLISLTNRFSFVWFTVITNLATVGIAFLAARQSAWGIAGLVAAPAVANIFCNYWRWPAEGARVLGTTWWRLMFRPLGKT